MDSRKKIREYLKCGSAGESGSTASEDLNNYFDNEKLTTVKCGLYSVIKKTIEKVKNRDGCFSDYYITQVADDLLSAFSLKGWSWSCPTIDENSTITRGQLIDVLESLKEKIQQAAIATDIVDVIQNDFLKKLKGSKRKPQTENVKAAKIFSAILLLLLFTAYTPAQANTIDKRSQILEFLQRNSFNMSQESIEREAEQMIFLFRNHTGSTLTNEELHRTQRIIRQQREIREGLLEEQIEERRRTINSFHGRVKSVYTNTYRTIERNGEVERGELLYRSIEYFNENGRLIEARRYRGDGTPLLSVAYTYTYIYDDMGKIMQRNRYNKEGRRVREFRYSYDSNDNLIRIIEIQISEVSRREEVGRILYDRGRIISISSRLFRQTNRYNNWDRDRLTEVEMRQYRESIGIGGNLQIDRSVHLVSTLRYDRRGNLVERIESRCGLRPSNTTTYIRDSRGFLTGSLRRDNSSGAVQATVYESDTQGNWIVRICNDYFYVRTIEYFEQQPQKTNHLSNILLLLFVVLATSLIFWCIYQSRKRKKAKSSVVAPQQIADKNEEDIIIL